MPSATGISVHPEPAFPDFGQLSAEFARSVVDSSPDCIKVLDLDGRLLSMNQAGCRQMEIDDFASCASKMWAEFWPEAARADAVNSVAAARAGEPSVFHGLCPTAKGNTRWWDVIVTPLKDPDGTPVRILCVSRDVTHQKEVAALLALKASLTSLSACVGAALSEVAVLPQALRICVEALVQNASLAFAGLWTLETGTDLFELQASAGLYADPAGPHGCIPVPAFKSATMARRREPWFSDNPARHAAFINRMIGDRRWARREGMVSFAVYPLVVEGRLIGVLGLFGQHRLDSDTLVALASIANTLAIGIQRKRTEQALLAKTLQLEKSNGDLEQFAFAAAHDLQEPMRMVNVYTELLAHELAESATGDARAFMDEVITGAKRMNVLLQDLLAYAETARSPTSSSRTIDLNLLLKEVMLNLQGSVENESARVTIGVLPSLRGHARHFTQLFQNLIGNALKYRSEEVPVVHVSAALRGGEWLFKVQDNGLGIDPQYHSLVFGMFKRLHGRAIPGTGIGLAICQKTVDRYGGRIWVESEGEGCGSVFCFTFPEARTNILNV